MILKRFSDYQDAMFKLFCHTSGLSTSFPSVIIICILNAIIGQAFVSIFISSDTIFPHLALLIVSFVLWCFFAAIFAYIYRIGTNEEFPPLFKYFICLFSFIYAFSAIIFFFSRAVAASVFEPAFEFISIVAESNIIYGEYYFPNSKIYVFFYLQNLSLMVGLLNVSLRAERWGKRLAFVLPSIVLAYIFTATNVMFLNAVKTEIPVMEPTPRWALDRVEIAVYPRFFWYKDHLDIDYAHLEIRSEGGSAWRRELKIVTDLSRTIILKYVEEDKNHFRYGNYSISLYFRGSCNGSLRGFSTSYLPTLFLFRIYLSKDNISIDNFKKSFGQEVFDLLNCDKFQEGRMIGPYVLDLSP